LIKIYEFYQQMHTRTHTRTHTHTHTEYKIVLQMLLHVSVPLHHLLGAYKFFAKVIKH